MRKSNSSIYTHGHRASVAWCHQVVAATSVSDNRQNDWARFSKRVKLSQSQQKWKRSQQPKYTHKHSNNKKCGTSEKKEKQQKGTGDTEQEVAQRGLFRWQAEAVSCCHLGLDIPLQDQTFRVPPGNRCVGLAGLLLAGGQTGQEPQSCCQPPRAGRHDGRSSPRCRRMQLRVFYHPSQIVPPQGAGKLRSPALQ